MAFDKQKVIEIAKAEVGYLEKKSNSQLDDPKANAGDKNYTKYARDLDAIKGFYNGPKNGAAYCDVFVDWCFVKAYGVENAKKLLCQPDYSAGAGCLYSAQYYKNAGRWVTRPKVGAQVFFSYSPGEYSHTGLVVEVSGTTLRTIEGNTSDGVFYRTYQISDNRILGYGMPDYGMAGSSSPTTSPTVPSASGKKTALKLTCALDLELVKSGYENSKDVVKIMQRQLKMVHGYNIGTSGIDGDFGTATKNALIKFQKAHNLVADGECGALTWRELFTAI